MAERSVPRGDTTEEDESSEVKLSRVQRGLEFARRWNTRRFMQEELSPEETDEHDVEVDDDDEESMSPRRRRGRRLSRLLRTVLPKPERVEDDAERPRARGTARLFDGLIHQELEDQVDPETDDHEPETFAETASAQETGVDVEEDDPVVDAHPFGGAPAGGLPPVVVAPNPRAAEPQPNIPRVVSDSLPQPVRDDRLPGAVGGLLALDVLNYAVSRHRDNKNKKENLKQHGKIHNELQKQKEARERLEAQTKSLDERINKQETAKQPEATPLPRVEKQGATPIAQMVQERNEMMRNLYEQRGQALPELPQIEQQSPEERIVAPPEVARVVTPEQIEKAVELAAEQNIPLEAMYEKSHEARGVEADQRSAAMARGSLAGGGPSTQAAMGGRPKIQHANGSLSDDALLKQTNTSAIPVKKDLYKQAARTGTIVSFVLIIILVFAIILTS